MMDMGKPCCHCHCHYYGNPFSQKAGINGMDANLFWLNRQVCGGRRGLVLRCICEFIPSHLWESRAFDRLQGGMNFYI